MPVAVATATANIPRYVPFNVADRSVGLYAFGVIASALFARERTGRGQRVDVPMFETMVPHVMGDHLFGHTFVPAKADFGYPRLMSQERRPYRTSDGYVCCLIYHDRHWRAFLRVIGKPDLFDADPRFATITSRTENITELYGMVSEEMQRRSTAEWAELLRGADIPVFPMHTFELLMEDDHLRDIGFFGEADHPIAGRIRTMAVPSEWSDTVPDNSVHAPALGEHSSEILAEVGYSHSEIAELIETGATAVAS